MMELNVNRAEFIRSAADERQFIHSPLMKTAFAGRSNVGKSSVINRLLNRKQFARVGSSPGKTVHINYFLIDEKLYLIDLPGYGFAKVSLKEKERWARLMERFFADQEACDRCILIVDFRHKPTEDDRRMADYCRNSGLDFAVVANKADKVKKSEREENIRLIRETLQLSPETELVPFSAESGEGRDKLLSCILKNL